MKIRYERLLPVYHWIWKHWRERRWERFRKYISPGSKDHLLDVGGCSSDWLGRGDLIGEVTLLNLDAYQVPDRDDSPHMTSVKGDGCNLEYHDNSFAIAYSNSVIEHVGSWKEQQSFASEIRRVGRKLWVQTPAYACPVEPHYLGLFVHWFPASWHVRVARWTSVVGLTGAADLDSIANTTRLLTKREFRLLFPDCKIWTERLFLIFPKSYVAFKK